MIMNERLSEVIQYTEFIKMVAKLGRIEDLIKEYVGNDEKNLKQLRRYLDLLLVKIHNEITVKGMQ